MILDYTEPEIKMIGFVFPNEKSDFQLAVFTVATDQVEQDTGIDFLPALPGDIEEDLESAFEPESWGISEVDQACEIY